MAKEGAKKEEKKTRREPLIWIRLSSPSKLLRAFVVSLIAVLTVYAAIYYEPGQYGIWFADVDEPILLGDAETGELVRQVVDGIFEQKLTRPTLAGLLRDRRPRIVILSLSNGDQPAKVIVGRGRGIVAAADDAIRRSREPMNRLYDPRWVKIDVVQQASTEPGFQFGGTMALTRASQGVAFPRATQLAFLPDQLVAYSLVDDQRQLRSEKIIAYLKNDARALKRFQRLDATKPLPVYWFSTISFFTDGKKFSGLNNGQRDVASMDGEAIVQGVKLGADFLAGAVNSEGRFLATSEPDEALALKYDYYQHAGALLALLHAGKADATSMNAEAIGRGLDFLIKHQPEDIGSLGLGLAVGSIWYRLRPASTSLPSLRQWAAQLLQKQKADGSFEVGTERRFEEFEGAAALGLWEWFNVDKSAPVLTSVQRAADYLVAKRDRGLPDARLLADRWLARTLSGLYRAQKETRYLEHLQRLAGAMIASQNLSAIFPAWRGSFFQPPDFLETGRRASVLCDSYKTVRAFGKDAIAQKLFESLQSASSFQIQNQFLPEKVLYVARPDQKLGGFPRGLSDYRISLENVQANVDALSCYLETLTH
ncbi:MAG: hypothetical protein KDD51_03350 [Bdellovibrionales bacterium]|nr:hypothetical protein [Bdellovibrionales bacterium]